MNPACGKAWSVEYIDAKFTVSWRRKELNKHRKKILVDREKALLITEMPAVEILKEMDQLKGENNRLKINSKARIDNDIVTMIKYEMELTPPEDNLSFSRIEREARKEAKRRSSARRIQSDTKESEIIEYKMVHLPTDHVLNEDEKKKIKADLREQILLAAQKSLILKKQISADNLLKIGNEERLKYLKQELKTIDEADIQYLEGKKRSGRVFVRPCPADNCRGFLSTAWKCGLCGLYVCNKCLAPKFEGRRDESHVCKEEDVESAQEIEKQTRGCPSCGVRIFRIEGCAQMFCTNCNVPFSWDTGQIITGPLHNPHFYEFLKRSGPNVQWKPESKFLQQAMNPALAGGEEKGCQTITAQALSDAFIKLSSQAYDRSDEMKQALAASILHELKQIASNSSSNNASYSDMNLSIILVDRLWIAALSCHNHISDIELKRLRDAVEVQGIEIHKRKLRRNYLLNKITQKTWETEILKIYNGIERKQTLIQIYEVVLQSIRQALLMILEGKAIEGTKTLQQVPGFSNELMKQHATRFSSTGKYLQISPIFETSKKYFIFETSKKEELTTKKDEKEGGKKTSVPKKKRKAELEEEGGGKKKVVSH